TNQHNTSFPTRRSSDLKEYPLSNDKEQDPFKKRFRISPAARKRAKELGVDTLQVTGTGPKGRITRRDIEKAAKEAGTTKKRLQTDRKSTRLNSSHVSIS